MAEAHLLPNLIWVSTFKEVFMKFNLTPVTKDTVPWGFPSEESGGHLEDSHVCASEADWERGASALLLMLHIQTNTINPVLKM